MGEGVTETPIIGDRFRVIRPLGEGGFGSVFLAEDLARDPPQIIALKILHSRFMLDPRVLERFEREAKIITALTHPNIARAFDFGLIDDRAYLAMEYVAGSTLKQMLVDRAKRAELFTLPEITRIVGGLAAGLAHAHFNGVVHRDLKPSNVLAGEEAIKIVDFGVAKVAGSDLHQATTLGRTIGSALYMAPEQITGQGVDGRSDVFSLGCITYELLTSCFAWARDENDRPLACHLRPQSLPGKNSQATIWMRGQDPVRPRPSQVRRELPPAVDAVIARALAIAPADRFPSATDLAIALQQALEDQTEPMPRFEDEDRPPSFSAEVETEIPDEHAATVESPPSGDAGAGKELRARKIVLAVLMLMTIALAIATFVHHFLDRPPVVIAVLAAAQKRPAPAAVATSTAGMVDMPAGKARLGCAPEDASCASDEGPLREIEVSAFAIDRTEVTVAAYRRCVEARACTAANRGLGCNWGARDRDLHPINCLDAMQAEEYCAFLGRRLPTDEEWEIAARSGDARVYPWGAERATCARANLAGCIDATAPAGAHPSGATAFGVEDLGGNVWEWIAARGSKAGGRRSIRGGSFRDAPEALRASNRGSADATARLEHLGFRCVR